MKFYTESEVSQLEDLLEKGHTPTQVAIALHKKFKRSKETVIQKCIILNKVAGRSKTKTEVKNITSIPKGMKLEFPASKISIENNRIIIYL
jgi:hypothetical protein